MRPLDQEILKLAYRSYGGVFTIGTLELAARKLGLNSELVQTSIEVLVAKGWAKPSGSHAYELTQAGVDAANELKL